MFRNERGRTVPLHILSRFHIRATYEHISRVWNIPQLYGGLLRLLFQSHFLGCSGSLEQLVQEILPPSFPGIYVIKERPLSYMALAPL